jgi:uncharacterized protein (TIGR02466 family)
MKKFEVLPLFPTPVYRTNLGGLETDIRTFIENIEYERMPGDQGDYSVVKNILDVPELAPLRARIMDSVNHFVYDFLDCKTTMTFELQNSWVNRHVRGDYSPQHHHGNAMLSGVYYIEIENLSDIVFHKDHRHLTLFNPIIDIPFNYTDTNDQRKMNLFNVQSFGCQPAKDDLLIFPSHLSHSVDTSVSDETRYTLAFNLFPRGLTGTLLSQLQV